MLNYLSMHLNTIFRLYSFIKFVLTCSKPRQENINMNLYETNLWLMVIHELAKNEVNQSKYSNLYSYCMKIFHKRKFLLLKIHFSHLYDNKARPLVTL